MDDVRYPVFERIPKKENAWFIIILISLVVIAIVVGIVIYAIYRPESTAIIGRCEPGLCVVNIASGRKTCPASTTERLEYDIVFETCSSASYCQAPEVPCAVLANGTLDCDGICGSGNSECNCNPRP